MIIYYKLLQEVLGHCHPNALALYNISTAYPNKQVNALCYGLPTSQGSHNHMPNSTQQGEKCIIIYLISKSIFVFNIRLNFAIKRDLTNLVVQVFYKACYSFSKWLVWLMVLKSRLSHFGKISFVDLLTVLRSDNSQKFTLTNQWKILAVVGNTDIFLRFPLFFFGY